MYTDEILIGKTYKEITHLYRAPLVTWMEKSIIAWPQVIKAGCTVTVLAPLRSEGNDFDLRARSRRSIGDIKICKYFFANTVLNTQVGDSNTKGNK